MSKIKAYKKQESTQQMASEPMVGYSCGIFDSDIVVSQRSDIKSAISGEELVNRLHPRIKALFK